MIKIYSDQNHYIPDNRFFLNNITKMLWDKKGSKRGRIKSKSVKWFNFEYDLSKADIYLLTYKWNYYFNYNKIPQAEYEVLKAKQLGKPLVVFCDGDYPANLPFEDVILFESAGYRSTPGLRYHSAQPSYIPDYLDVYCNSHLQFRQKRVEPVIGFCGLASTSPLQSLYRRLKLKNQQRQYQKGRLKCEPPPFETSSFRRKVLHQFNNRPGNQTKFILRKRYRAGVIEDKSLQHPAKVEFVNNNLNSDYTVCMRGGGNFSVRFYETICLGRIPIFIDTDCLLPFQDEIDYKSIFPWINMKDLPHAAEILRNFHARLSEDDFLDLQKACRRLWIEHMTPDGFHRDFISVINSIK